jgi:hypothetical protein
MTPEEKAAIINRAHETLERLAHLGEPGEARGGHDDPFAPERREWRQPPPAAKPEPPRYAPTDSQRDARIEAALEAKLLARIDARIAEATLLVTRELGDVVVHLHEQTLEDIDAQARRLRELIADVRALVRSDLRTSSGPVIDLPNPIDRRRAN